jgi:hypothetical protein
VPFIKPLSFNASFCVRVLVYKQAVKVNIQCPQFDAKYVKRTKLKDYLPQSILKLELKTVKRNESSSTMLNAANGNANSMSNSTSSSNLANQVTLMRNESNNSFVYSAQRSIMSPSSDSSDSVFTYNNKQQPQQQVQPNQPLTNTDTTTTNNTSELNESTSVPESAANSNKNSEINEDELNANNKRAYSPTTHEHLQTQIKKQKESLSTSESIALNKSTSSNGVAETNGVELTMAVDNQATTNSTSNGLVEEELLDSLPMPQSSNRLINSNPISIVKNSIRVNIGCNKK